MTRIGDLGDGINQRRYDESSYLSTRMGPSNQCLTCFKRGNAATSICSDRALGPNQSCVVYFRNRHRQSGITIGIVSKFHELFKERMRTSRGDLDEEEEESEVERSRGS